MLKNLHLINFRSYKDFKIDFSNTTVIAGPNGIGKTNLIEAIYLLSTTSSYRTNKGMELIHFNEQFLKLKANLNNKCKIELVIQNNKKISKTVKINDIEKSLKDVIGKMKTVIFSPESIKIVLGQPNFRRMFLNVILAQINKVYLENLYELKKVLKQRNKLLFLIRESKANELELDFWDEKLIKINNNLVLERKKLIDFFNKRVSQYYNQISNSKNLFSIKYKESLPARASLKTVNENRKNEIEKAISLYGPHRDEIIFYLNNRTACKFSSRGEARTIILALKLAELDLISTKSGGKRPILLLDDVFSELDSERVHHLLNVLGNQQTIITTTNLLDIKKFLKREYKIVDLVTSE